MNCGIVILCVLGVLVAFVLVAACLILAGRADVEIENIEQEDFRGGKSRSGPASAESLEK